MQQTVVEQQDQRQSQILPGWRRELWMTDEVKAASEGEQDYGIPRYSC